MFIDTWLTQNKIEWLEPAVDWIRENEPKDRVGVICHGDFHPLNILVDKGKISAVLDWSGARIGEPERDIASTKNILSLLGLLAPGVDWALVSNDYFKSYMKRANFDSDKEEYYEAVHCINMLEALESGFLNEIEGLRERLLLRFTEITELTLIDDFNFTSSG